MNRYSGFFFSLFIALSLSLGGIADAEAKRLGGGGSFGGKSSFSSPFKRNTGSLAPVRTPSQQKAFQQNQTARQGLSQRGGLMGMLGGLAIGGLLGAMLFGGAFENFNFMDLLIFGGIAYLLYRVLAARRATLTPQPAYQRSAGSQGQAPRAEPPHQPELRPDSNARFDNNDWFRGGAAGSTAAGGDGAADADFDQPSLPADFDAEGFLTGAKAAYRMLQKAWDARDLSELRGLTTDVMFGELQERIKEIGADNRTEVLKLDAELLDAREVGDMLEAVVLFDGILREAADDKARQVREVWHFTRAKQSNRPTWFLDGIQQMED